MDGNPYQPTGPSHQSAPPPSSKTQRLGCLASGLLGALAATVGAFPVASLVGFVYRFPIPFSGYASGIKAVVPALFAVLLYGMVGGFVVVAVLGALAGFLAHRIASVKDLGLSGSLFLVLCLAIFSDLPCVLLLAVLDKIIGPW